MLRIIKKTNIDFIGKRRVALIVSTVINLAILIGIVTVGFNYGVDFAGGTLVEVQFNHPVSPQEVRKRAEAGGLDGVSVQGIGSSSENSYLLRVGGTTQLTPEGAEKAKTAMGGLGEISNVYADLDNGLINLRAPATVTAEELKQAVEGSGTEVYQVRTMGEAAGGGVDYQVVAAGMADKIRAAMSAGMETPDYQTRRVDYVGPQVGKQLRNKGIMALIYAMLAILLYVAFRFDFKFAPGALVALVHDAIMVSGFYLVSRHEFNLTAIAALLTIIGYSINDTIVIYDRIREDMARFKGKPLAEIINLAVNDMLGRTILTALVTGLSLLGLLVFSVGEIWDFAMAMLVGVVVGIYSTIYIASPLTIWLDERAAAREKAGKTGGPGSTENRAGRPAAASSR
ncbi:MAG: protein translocase subunit SecF [Myxococcota bacterium]|nr:protein translocase subunit SecF [Myxococcota bacterium]